MQRQLLLLGVHIVFQEVHVDPELQDNNEHKQHLQDITGLLHVVLAERTVQKVPALQGTLSDVIAQSVQ